MASCQEPEETELRVQERQHWVRVIQGWLWLQQHGGEGCLRQAEQDCGAVPWMQQEFPMELCTLQLLG